MTQREMVWEYLQRNGSITPKQAEMPPIRTMRLADHIHKLRKSGKHIETTMKSMKVDGRKIEWAEYRIAREEERGPEVAD